MKKWYEKNELRFALIWILIYCFVSLPLRSALGDTHPLLSLWFAVFAGVLLLFMKQNGLLAKYGLVKWQGPARSYLYFIPVLLVMTGNLWHGIGPVHTGAAQLFAVLAMLLAGLSEELIFRGLLFRALLKKGRPAAAIAISALTFGLGHLINLLAGQGGLESLLQVVFACAWGFLFTYLFYKSGSLLICILAHGFINASSKFALPPAEGQTDLAFILLTLAAAVLYGLFLRRRPACLKAE